MNQDTYRGMKKKPITPCWVCNKKAIGKLSPDLDIEGIGFCLKHKTLVMAAYIQLIHGDSKLIKEIAYKS